ncbi:hypothetical protein [Noviherbaspirillum sp.]|uniref:hypothetical protein n=1 Tax=Noviherbaspirillum sp. TaxID=1926288 RepID=UPI002B4A5642|nr:hypothetical protein [Noviherbaspirillum sp.]
MKQICYFELPLDPVLPEVPELPEVPDVPDPIEPELPDELVPPDAPLDPELSPPRRSQPTAVMLSAARINKIFEVVLSEFILVPFMKSERCPAT